MTDDSRQPDRVSGDGAKHPVNLQAFQSREAHVSVILVAVDNVIVRNLVTLSMEEEGHFVLAAADGNEGLELSRKYRGEIELVITDVQLPRLNGIGLCAYLSKERPGIKVLVMASAGTSEGLGQNVNLPFLPKPFDGETLKERVRKISAASVQPPMGVPVSPRSDGLTTKGATWM